MRRVEHDPGWEWIARRKDGSEVLIDHRWPSRGIASSVVRSAGLPADFLKQIHPAPVGTRKGEG